MRVFPHHELIKAQLRENGSSMYAIARKLGVQPSTVTIVSQGLRRSRRIEAAIASALNTTPEVLFADRYAEEEVAMQS